MNPFSAKNTRRSIAQIKVHGIIRPRKEKRNAYTEAFSGGVARGGSGYLSSKACVITSESGTHFSSNFTTGTLPSGVIFKNLETSNKKTTH